MDPGKDENLFVLVQKPKPCRQMRSLGVLTRNFVRLLHEEGNTALDLRYVRELPETHELGFLTFYTES